MSSLFTFLAVVSLASVWAAVPVCVDAQFEFNQWWQVHTYERSYNKNNRTLENRFNLFYHDELWYNVSCGAVEIEQAKECYKRVYNNWNIAPTHNRRGIQIEYSRISCCAFWELTRCLNPVIRACDLTFHFKLHKILAIVYEAANEKCFPHWEVSASCQYSTLAWMGVFLFMCLIVSLCIISGVLLVDHLEEMISEEMKLDSPEPTTWNAAGPLDDRFY